MLLALLLCLVAAPVAAADTCTWDNCNKWSTADGVINVHIVPHTHDDLGWIKTVDQYYFGLKEDLVPVGVQYIYNTVIRELALDSTKRFSFAETGFLSRWYRTHSADDQKKLQDLVKNGQVEIIGGGWAQTDEAAAHYVDFIDQMELGLNYLDGIFGECGHAQTGWQIDPFGHSREIANLHALMGYSSFYFARMHYLEKAARLANKSLEINWNTSDDFKTSILTGAFYQDNYGPPEGFCFDRFCGDDAIQDNPDMESYNLPEKMAAFVKHVKEQASYQRTNHVLLLMGSDFQYSDANMWFTNLDKIILHINANYTNKINAFYSTPTCYTNAVNSAKPQLSSKNDDFFPYASSDHSFWTGYFTSRPTFKALIREASAKLQLVKQLDAMAYPGSDEDSNVEAMKEASGLVQHHDAVTGTAKEAVTRDYEKRLAAGLSKAEDVINHALSGLAAKTNGTNLPHHFLCPLLNETTCDPLKSLSSFAVTVFNPLATAISQTIRIPFYSSNATVQGSSGAVDAQIFKTFQSSLNSTGRAPYELAIAVSLPPLGFTTYFVSKSAASGAVRVIHPLKQADTPSTIENKYLSVTFDAKGYVSSVYDKEQKVAYPLKQQFFYYEGNGNIHEQTSGAYVFRPKANESKAFEGNITIEFSKGKLLEEARQTVSPWASQIVRLSKESRDIEFTWTIGPIPKETGNDTLVTKEVITRYTTGIKSAGLYYTDANGRQLMQRKRNFNANFAYVNSEPISANYYPITSSVHINDANSQLTVLVDRAQGAASLVDGEIEVMLHRRCFYDDHWGVEEALDEPGTDGRGLIVTGSHVIQIGDVKKAAGRLRLGAQAVFHRPIPAFADTNYNDYTKQANTSFSGLTAPLPPSVHLLSLSKASAGQLLLRLEHVFQYADQDAAAANVTVDLNNLFSTINVKSIKEVQLAGIREPKQPQKSDDLKINLKPMEIRTFILNPNGCGFLGQSPTLLCFITMWLLSRIFA